MSIFVYSQRRSWKLPACLLLLMTTTSAVHPAGADQTKPKSDFTESQVRHSLDNIEDLATENQLRSEYFASRHNFGFSRLKGFEVLESEIQKPGAWSKSLVLKSLAGFAGIRLSSDLRTKGLGYYDELFSQVDSTYTERDLLRAGAAANDLVTAVAFGVGSSADKGGEDAKVALLSALRASVVVSTNAGAANWMPSPNWRSCVLKVGAYQDFASVVDQMETKYRMEENLNASLLTAQIYSAFDPNHSNEVLKSAKHLLKAEDSERTKVYYSLLVDNLVSAGKVDDAIEAQQELSQLCHCGLARLAVLQHEHGDKAQFKGTLERINRLEGEPYELVQVAAQLLEWARDTPRENNAKVAEGVLMRIAGITLSERQFDTDSVVAAKCILGKEFIERGDMKSAKAVLDGVPRSPNASLRTKLYYAAIDNLRQKIR